MEKVKESVFWYCSVLFFYADGNEWLGVASGSLEGVEKLAGVQSP